MVLAIGPKYHLFFLRLAAILLLALAGSAAFAYAGQAGTPALILPEMGDSAPLAHHAGYFIDESGDATAAHVYASPELFHKPSGGKTSFGIITQPVWLKFSVENPAGNPFEWILAFFHSHFDFIDIYIFSHEKLTAHIHGGEERKPTGIWGGSYSFRFPINTPAGAKQEIFVRLAYKSLGVMDTYMTAFTEDGFDKNSAADNMFFGAIVGVAMFMFLYNLLLYASTRSSAYFWYSVYLVPLLLLFLSFRGIADRYLNVAFHDTLSPALAIIVVFFSTQFSRVFLDLKNRMPIADKLMLAVMTISAPLAILALMGYKALIVKALVVFGIIYFIYPATGAWLWYQGHKEARVYTLGWTFWVIGNLIMIARVAGLAETSLVIMHLPKLCVILEAALFSIALADRLNIMREQKEHAEELYHATVGKAKEELEKQVILRTAELREQKDKAEQATALKDKFVSLVSHDLRSPLGAVKGLLDIASETGGAEMSREQILEITKKGAASLGKTIWMIGTLLDITRLQTGKIVPVKSDVNIRSLVINSLEYVSMLAQGKGIGIVNDIPPGMRLYADESLLGEVVQNLLTNSVKFCRRNDVVRVYAPDGKPNIIAVSDTGPGIIESFREKLFAHDTKTTSTGSAGEEGTGLGLPYSRDIMLAHGGDLKYEPNHPNGATFLIVLP